MDISSALHLGIELFNAKEQESLLDITSAYMLVAPEDVYQPVQIISEQAPFIFFHQRKSGGQSLRSTLVAAARKLKLSYFVPCFNKIKCDIYTMPMIMSAAQGSHLNAAVTHKSATSVAVYGGHFYWGAQKRLLKTTHAEQVRRKDTSIAAVSTSAATVLQVETGNSTAKSRLRKSRQRVEQFSCVTNLREPTSRIVSCLYYRFLVNKRYKAKSGCIDSLTIPELVFLLAEETDSFSNSCLNEPFRILSGFVDEDIINALGLRVRQQPSNTQRGDGGDTNSRHIKEAITDMRAPGELGTSPYTRVDGVVAPEPYLSSMAAHVLKVTLMQRLTKCPPIILEYPQSAELISRKFPLLHRKQAFNLTVPIVKYQGKYNNSCGGPRADQLQLIRRFSALERVLYDEALGKAKQAYNMLLS